MIAFATSRELPGGWDDDREAARLAGAEFVVWDDPAVDWEAYDRVVIRSVWDYSHRLEEFLAWCAAVGDGRLRNAPALVAFNADKRYLGELRARTAPTTFVGPGDPLPELSHVLRKRAVLRGEGEAPLGEGAHAPAAVMLEDDLVTAGEAEPAQAQFAVAVVAEVTERFGTPLYARVDVAHDDHGLPVLMELEAIEPCLYFDLVPGAAERFARALLAG